jgi:hypothetical protein
MKTQQQGFAHAFLIITLLVALTGALGFVFWQNFIYEEPKVSSIEATPSEPKPNDDEVVSQNEIFSNSQVTFEYPRNGWNEVEPKNADEIARLETDNFKPNIGMGLESGASLAITTTTAQDIPSIPGLTDAKEITIDGDKAFSFALDYEGYRLQAIVFTNRESNYLITMETVSSPTAEEKSVFSSILSTIDFK